MDDAVIISDIHLGSDSCEAHELWEFLEQLPGRTKQLILNGDVFDSIDFRRLHKHHWHVLSSLRHISDQLKVVWICGNHDGPAEIISHLLGLGVKSRYEFLTGNKRVLVLHGNHYDNFIDQHPVLTWVGDTIYWLCQKADRTHYVARLAKTCSKHYLRCAEKLRIGAAGEAKKKGCHMVCCGHTHFAEVVEVDQVTYFNSGCWTERPMTYLSFRDGKGELNKWTGGVCCPVAVAAFKAVEGSEKLP